MASQSAFCQLSSYPLKLSQGSAPPLNTSEPFPVCKSSMPWAFVCLGTFTSFALHLVSTAERLENDLGARSSHVTFKLFLILYLALKLTSHINRQQEMVGKLVESTWGKKRDYGDPE